MNLSTAQMLEALLGKTTTTYRQPSNSDWSMVNNRQRQYVGRSLFTADELRRLEYPVLLTENEPATLLKAMAPYFRNSVLDSRAEVVMPSHSFPAFDKCEFLRV